MGRFAKRCLGTTGDFLIGVNPESGGLIRGAKQSFAGTHSQAEIGNDTQGRHAGTARAPLRLPPPVAFRSGVQPPTGTGPTQESPALSTPAAPAPAIRDDRCQTTPSPSPAPKTTAAPILSRSGVEPPTGTIHPRKGSG